MDYPTDEELETLKSWEFKKDIDFIGFVVYLTNLWSYPDRWRFDDNTLELSTGGWSGNESIIAAMQETIFWTICWEESRRGGHYKFNLKRAKFKVSDFEGLFNEKGK